MLLYSTMMSNRQSEVDEQRKGRDRRMRKPDSVITLPRPNYFRTLLVCGVLGDDRDLLTTDD